MDILLTGASGFLGREIRAALLEHNVLFLDRSSNMRIDLSKNIPSLSDVDVVIHAAGKAHAVPKTEREKQVFFDVNVRGTQNLLKGIESAMKLPKYFIFISSVAVYGLENGNGITEDYPLKAVDAYGLSKIEAEKIVHDWCVEKNVICTILRLPLLAGANPPGNLGAMIKGISNGYYFNIAGGKAKKSMVLVQDVAKFILPISKVGGIYNLTDGKHPSFSELSEKIACQLGRKKPIHIPFWFAKVMAIVGDIIGKKAPINSSKLMKINSDLTFDDTKAVESFHWDPTPVLNGFKIK